MRLIMQTKVGIVVKTDTTQIETIIKIVSEGIDLLQIKSEFTIYACKILLRTDGKVK